MTEAVGEVHVVTRNALSLLLPIVFACFLFIEAGPAQAQVADLQRERTPALTTFPEYPEDARRNRLEGEATACFTIDAKGGVNRARISSSTDEVFEKPTLKAIRASTFEPLATGQIESRTPTCRTYRFTLDQLAPLYVPRESTEPEGPLAGSVASIPLGSVPEQPSPPEQAILALSAAAAETPAAGDTLITAAAPLRPAEPICATRRRPGTRIDYTYCYTPEQQVEATEAKERFLHDLDRETQSRDQAILEYQISHGGAMPPVSQ